MTVVNLIIALIALVIAVMAYKRAGGTTELRDKTADTLGKMEKALRRIEAKEEQMGPEQ